MLPIVKGGVLIVATIIASIRKQGDLTPLDT